MEELPQLVAIGIVTGSAYALLAVGFGLILQVTGRFHLAFSASYALAGYTAAELTSSQGAPFVVAALAGMAVAAALGMAIEHFIYWPLTPRAGSFVLLAIFTAALGLTTVGSAAMNLIWIESASKQIAGFPLEAVTISDDVVVTNLDIAMIVTSWAAIVAVFVAFAVMPLGRMVRAVRSNLEMSLAVGISPRLIYLLVFGIGSALGGLGAVFAGTKGAVTPDMGAASILYALTIVFLAGETASPIRIALVGLGIGLVETLSTLWINPSWSPVAVFGILLVVAALKPYHLPSLLPRRQTAQA